MISFLKFIFCNKLVNIFFYLFKRILFFFKFSKWNIIFLKNMIYSRICTVFCSKCGSIVSGWYLKDIFKLKRLTQKNVLVIIKKYYIFIIYKFKTFLVTYIYICDFTFYPFAQFARWFVGFSDLCFIKF